MRRAPLVAVLLLLLAACTAEPRDPAVRPASPDVASSAEGAGDALAFSAAALDGGTVEGGEFAGQDLMLWFWAPW